LRARSDAVRLEENIDPGLDRGLDILSADRIHNTEQEALVDIALAEIDELPGCALGIGNGQRARFLQVFKLSCKTSRAVKGTRFVERADIRLMRRTPKSFSIS
jgi:hypothetical protein